MKLEEIVEIDKLSNEQFRKKIEAARKAVEEIKNLKTDQNKGADSENLEEGEAESSKQMEIEN